MNCAVTNKGQAGNPALWGKKENHAPIVKQIFLARMENQNQYKLHISQLQQWNNRSDQWLTDYDLDLSSPLLSLYRMDSITCNIKPCCPDEAIWTEESAGNYDFSSFFFFWNFLNCDWMATAAFSVSGASMSMSKSSGMSFLDASGHRKIS